MDASIPAAPAPTPAAAAASIAPAEAAAQPPDALVLSVCTGRGGLACGAAGTHTAVTGSAGAATGTGSDCFGLAEPDAVDLLRHVFTAVDHAHSHGVALRSIGWHSFKYVNDTKSSPIQLVDLSSAILLTDEQTAEPPSTKSTAANPFDAPEFKEDRDTMSGREWRATDMYVLSAPLLPSGTHSSLLVYRWSLGVMAFVCLTDSFPFESNDVSVSLVSACPVVVWSQLIGR